jgi:hypothetical protein
VPLPLQTKFSAFSAQPIDNENGLVGWWTFDDGTATDFSGNQNNGVFINAPIFGAGKLSNSLKLNGTSQYATISDAPMLRAANVTVLLWFSLTSLPGIVSILCRPQNGPPWSSPYLTWLIRVRTSTLVEIDVGNSTTYSNADWTVPSISLGQWHHIGFTYSPGALKAYFDGVSLGVNATVTGALNYVSGFPIVIGADYGSSPAASYFPGYVDDVKIWAQALSPQDINTVYNQDNAYRQGNKTADFGVGNPG